MLWRRDESQRGCSPRNRRPPCLAGPVIATLMLLAVTAIAGPVGAVAPGDQVAPGNSLFDRLFGGAGPRGSTHDIPFPFEALMAALQARLPPGPENRPVPYSTVLIPLGRSLQREAAHPDFYRFPRIVLAVDTESSHRYLSKDRLFLGYQERSEQIEVISYNEDAGRFEFQLVVDYAPGKIPVVNNANRTLCQSCHQNGATIFSKSTWSETSFDRGIAAQLAEHGANFHGIGTQSEAGEAGRIDASTDRANLLSAYQRIWRDGCRHLRDTHVELRCRAGLFRAMVLNRLLGDAFSAQDNNLLHNQDYRAVIKDNWETQWPDGMPIPESDLPNRVPVAQLIRADLPPSIDPLSIRPPRAYWDADFDVDRAIKGLAESFLLKSDIVRLDHVLRRQLQDRHDSYTGNCRFQKDAGVVGNAWLEIECGITNAGAEAMEIIATLFVDDADVVHEGLSWIYLANENRYAPASLSGAVETDVTGHTRANLLATKRYQVTRARAWNGAAISRVEFDWKQPENSESVQIDEFPGSVNVELTYDLQRIERAVASLLNDATSGTFTGFNDQPIRGIALLSALFDKLNADYPSATPASMGVSARTPTHAALADVASDIPSVPANPTIALFTRYCGTCHRTKAQLPPGFLVGEPNQVTDQLRECVARIRFRLGMWQLNETDRTKTPMPPPAFLHAAAIDIEEWRHSEDYANLVKYSAALSPNRAAITAPRQYATLPPCITPHAGG